MGRCNQGFLLRIAKNYLAWEGETGAATATIRLNKMQEGLEPSEFMSLLTIIERIRPGVSVREFDENGNIK